jgi:hypothetical protein
MPDSSNPIQISETTRQEMQRICRRATAGQDVPDAVRDELYGHLEDKLLGYLSGEERLTEADAMILVREHFGRPEALRPILAYAHAETEAAGPPVWRRIAGAAVVLSAAWVATGALRNAAVFAFFRAASARGVSPDWLWMVLWYTPVVMSILVAAVLYAGYRKWASREGSEAAWFARWKPASFAAALLALFLLNWSVGISMIYLHRWAEVVPSQPFAYPRGFEPTIVLVSLAASTSQAVAWLAWVVRPDRRSWRLPLYAAGAWVAYWPVWFGLGFSPAVSTPGGGWSIGFHPQWIAGTIMMAAMVVVPALALYLTPRAYRWLLSRRALRAAIG